MKIWITPIMKNLIQALLKQPYEAIHSKPNNGKNSAMKKITRKKIHNKTSVAQVMFVSDACEIDM